MLQKGYLTLTPKTLTNNGKLQIQQISTYDSLFLARVKEKVPDFSNVTILHFYRSDCVDSEYENLSSFISLFSLEKIIFEWCDINISRLCGAIGQATALCYSQSFYQTHYDNFCKFFETCKSIKTLDLYMMFQWKIHNFPHRFIESLSKSGLESITLNWASPPWKEYIGDHLCHIGKLIETSPTLKVFGLVDAVLFAKTIDFLCQSISKSNLTSLNFRNLKMSPECYSRLFDAIANSSVTYLTVTPMLSGDNFCSFRKMVKHLKGLHLMDISESIFKSLHIIDIIANDINLKELSIYPASFIYDTDEIQKVLEKNGNIIHGYCEVLPNFKDIIERNSRNHATCREVCLYLVAIKRFRKSTHLQYLGRDMSTLLAKHLLQTRFDVDAWH